MCFSRFLSVRMKRSRHGNTNSAKEVKLFPLTERVIPLLALKQSKINHFIGRLHKDGLTDQQVIVHIFKSTNRPDRGSQTNSADVLS